MGTTKKTENTNRKESENEGSFKDWIVRATARLVRLNAEAHARLLEAMSSLTVEDALKSLNERIARIPGDILTAGALGVSDVTPFDGDRWASFKCDGAMINVFFMKLSGWDGFGDYSKLDVDNAEKGVLGALRVIHMFIDDHRERVRNRQLVVDRLIPAVCAMEEKVRLESAKLMETIRRCEILPVGC